MAPQGTSEVQHNISAVDQSGYSTQILNGLSAPRTPEPDENLNTKNIISADNSTILNRDLSRLIKGENEPKGDNFIE